MVRDHRQFDTHIRDSTIEPPELHQATDGRVHLHSF
jgi:hypothetical protein